MGRQTTFFSNIYQLVRELTRAGAVVTGQRDISLQSSRRYFKETWLLIDFVPSWRDVHAAAPRRGGGGTWRGFGQNRLV